MPVVCDISLSLDAKEVLRRGGIKGRSGGRGEMAVLLQELLVEVENSNLLAPAIAYELYTVTEVRREGLCLGSNGVLHGSLLSKVLSSARELAVVVGTVGPKLERKVAEYFDRGEPLRGVLLDGIGSAAVDSLTQETCRFMMDKVSSRGYRVSSPLSPGMNFPISEQWRLFELVAAEEIGVSLTSSGVMVPLKSASMVIGVAPEMPSWTQAEVCTRCSLKKTCLYRIPA